MVPRYRGPVNKRKYANRVGRTRGNRVVDETTKEKKIVIIRRVGYEKVLMREIRGKNYLEKPQKVFLIRSIRGGFIEQEIASALLNFPQGYQIRLIKEALKSNTPAKKLKELVRRGPVATRRGRSIEEPK